MSFNDLLIELKAISLPENWTIDEKATGLFNTKTHAFIYYDCRCESWMISINQRTLRLNKPEEGLIL